MTSLATYVPPRVLTNADLEKLVETTDEAWDNIVELNLTSCVLLSREIAPSMIQNKWGRIIYTSSIMGLASNPARGCYSATKAALLRGRGHGVQAGKAQRVVPGAPW